MRCLLGLFGINRSLSWTAPSIRRNILSPLAAAGHEVFIAAHFNMPARIDSTWSGEVGVSVQRGADKELPLNFLCREPQSDDNIEGAMAAGLRVPYRDNVDATGRLRRNLLQQLHSMRRLQQMIGVIGWEKFDAFLLMRPDLDYLDPIDVAAVERIGRGELDIVTPSWHQWGGMNDRFAYCNRAAAEIFLGRWREVESFCRGHGFIHSETLLAEAVWHACLKVATTDQRALRVRATGETWAEGFRLSRLMRAKHRARPVIRRASRAVETVAGLVKGAVPGVKLPRPQPRAQPRAQEGAATA